MTQLIQLAHDQADVSETAQQGTKFAKVREFLAACFPHKDSLRPSERRLIGICEWSLRASRPVTDEQSNWLEEIASRFAPSCAMA